MVLKGRSGNFGLNQWYCRSSLGMMMRHKDHKAYRQLIKTWFEQC